MIRAILTLLCIINLTTMPTLSHAEGSKTAYTVEDIVSFTHSSTPYKLASKHQWLLHDSRLKAFHAKLLRNPSSLVDNPKFQTLKARSLRERDRFSKSSKKIIAGKAQIDSDQIRLANKVGKMFKDNNRAINHVFSAIDKFDKSFDEDWAHDNVVLNFEHEAYFLQWSDPISSIPPSPSSCRDMALSFVSMRDFLHNHYDHLMKHYRTSKHHPRAELDQAYIESDIASINNAMRNLSGKNPSYKITPSNEKNWRFCAKIVIKTTRKTKELVDYLARTKKTLFGNPINDKQVAAFLNEK